MASSAFKSTSRRGNLNSSIPYRNRDSDSTQKTAPPPPVRKRSLSVNAISRTKQLVDISTDFSNKRENPLFWASSLTDNGSNEISAPVKTTGGQNQREKIFVEGTTTEKGSGKTVAADQRGRSVTRSSGVKNGIGRSISRVRGRSVSRGHYAASKSEEEQDVATFTSSRNSDLKQVVYKVKNDTTVGSGRDLKTINSQRETAECSEDDSACSFQISNWEDGISTCSLSEAEEKTIKAVCEQMKPFQIDQWGADRSASGIYETVRSEVKRAISDIQNDLESVIRRKNVNAITTSSVADIPQHMVGTRAIEFVMDIRREYAQKLKESEERARKLRADLALEEHQGKELSRILQEILPDPKSSNPQKSRMGRKRSTERKKISRRLTEEAMAYFDECVSISPLDSSDFSAPEDPPRGLGGPWNLVGGCVLGTGGNSGNNLPLKALDNCSNNNQAVFDSQDQHLSCEDSNLTANSSSCVPEVEIDSRATSGGNSQPHQFSFAQQSKENFETRDIKSYIKHFQREVVDRNMVLSDVKRSEYDSCGHDWQGNIQRLSERVLSKNRIESGGLHLCAGNFTVSFSPFGSFL